MQVRPGAHTHHPVAGVLACVLCRGFGPSARVRALHLGPVTARPAGMSGRASEARIGVETATCPQTDEDLRGVTFQLLLQLHGIVAGVEDKQGNVPFLLGRPAHKRFHLLSGHLVGVLRGADALHIHGGGPTLADEADLGDELIGPAGDDRLPSRVPRRVVVEAALGATLGVAAGPYTRIHGVVDGRSAPSKRMTGEQRPHGFGVDASSPERGVTLPQPRR